LSNDVTRPEIALQSIGPRRIIYHAATIRSLKGLLSVVGRFGRLNHALRDEKNENVPGGTGNRLLWRTGDRSFRPIFEAWRRFIRSIFVAEQGAGLLRRRPIHEWRPIRSIRRSAQCAPVVFTIQPGSVTIRAVDFAVGTIPLAGLAVGFAAVVIVAWLFKR